VVVADRARGEELPLAEGHRVALDIYLGKGSLGGIFSGLMAVRGEWGLVVACDMPFLNLELLRYMMSLREGADAVVPVLEGRPEPTHALYSRACLPHIEERLKADDLKIAGFFDEVRVKYVPEEDIARFDPDYLSFFNINSQPDLDKALVSQGRYVRRCLDRLLRSRFALSYSGHHACAPDAGRWSWSCPLKPAASR
jgi:molybdenum cofactor guanylyltransferase